MATPEPRVEMVSDGAFDLVPRRLWTWPGGSRTMLSSRAGSQMTDFEQLWVWRDPALARSLGWYGGRRQP